MHTLHIAKVLSYILNRRGHKQMVHKMLITLYKFGVRPEIRGYTSVLAMLPLHHFQSPHYPLTTSSLCYAQGNRGLSLHHLMEGVIL